MGLDGGTYITRSDVLRRSSWDLATRNTSRSTRGGAVDQSKTLQRQVVDTQTARETRWSTCTLTGEPLAEPLGADFLGSLYNRVAVLEFLLGRSGVFADEQAEHRYANQLREGGAAAFEHLRSARDVFTLRLLPAVGPPRPAAGGPAAPDSGGDRSLAGAARFACPVTALPCTSYPFAALPACGHAFSARAIAQMTDGHCATCGAPFHAADIVPLNGTAEQVAALREGMAARRARLKLTSSNGHKKRKLAALEHPPDTEQRDSIAVV